MTILTIEQNQTVQSYLKLAVRVLDRFGLELIADANLDQFKELYRSIPGSVRVPKTHDPSHSYCHPDNAFWIGFLPIGSERPIALCAHRVLDTEDLVSEMYTHRLFSDIGPVVDAHEIGLQEGLPRLAGRLGSNGGIVVAEDWRGRRLDGWPDLRLGGLIARIAQSLSIRRFRIDFQYSFTQNSIKRRDLAAKGYGMLTAPWPPRGTLPLTRP